MSNQTTLETENNPSAGNQWTQIPHVVEELTRQRDKLAKSHRKYEAGQGDELNPWQELQAVRDAISKAIPDLAVSLDTSPPDMLVRELAATYWDQVKQHKHTAGTSF